jgi:hypothetical protein
MEQLGRLLVAAGIILVAIGVVTLLVGRIPGLRLGHLPGDIVIQRPYFSIYIPLTTMLLVSAVLSGAMWLLGRWFR